MHASKSLLSLTLIIISFISQCVCSPLVTKSTNCVNLTIPVIASAENAILLSNLDNLDIPSLLDTLAGVVFNTLNLILVSGTFKIAATYCTPTVNVPSRVNTLQFLVHGITYTKAYWFGEYYNDFYSWAAYATAQGYPVLAIDRLGNGQSDHPDPILYLQHPMQTEVLHQIILLARQGSLPEINTAFSKIVFVGHSYGSCLGNNLNNVYPADVDAIILTGYSAVYVAAVPGVLADVVLVPADVEDSRYRGLDVGYLEFSDQVGSAFVFYTATGYYDPNLAALDFRTRGTIAIGEAATIALTLTNALEYKGPVFVITGQQDQVMCGTTRLGLLGGLLGGVLASADCSVGTPLTSVQNQYPNAASFATYSVPNAGHCWALTYAANATFGVAHTWMAERGF